MDEYFRFAVVEQMTAQDPEALPPQIALSMERHKARVAELVASLRSAGMPEDAILTSVRSVVASYEQELLAALSALKEE
jgi:hypothetical protein